MLSTKNMNCDSFPELEVTYQKWEQCHQLIAKSTHRDIRFQSLSLSACSRVKPVSYAWYGPDEDTTNFVLVCGGYEKDSCLLALSAGLSTITGTNLLLCAGLHRMLNQPLQIPILDHSPVLSPYSTISSLSQSADIESNPYFHNPPQIHPASSLTSKSRMHTTQASFQSPKDSF